MRFQIPQFIETEDKIIGPLTVKQFLFVAAGAGLSFVLYFMLAPAFWIMAVAVIGTLALALAFVKINGQPLPRILLSALFFMSRPRLYLWRRKMEEKVIDIPDVKSFAPITVGIQKKSGLSLLKDKMQTGSRAVPVRETPQISRLTQRAPQVEPQPAPSAQGGRIMDMPKPGTYQPPPPQPAQFRQTPLETPAIYPSAAPARSTFDSPVSVAPENENAGSPAEESGDDAIITLADGTKKKVQRVDY
jgi:hypothetical protein